MNGGARWVRQRFSIDHLGRIKSVGRIALAATSLHRSKDETA